MEFLVFAPVLLMSIVLHEVAHAWQARVEGDTTAEREGRITLNPLPHLDPLGSVILPLLLWFGGTGFIFGWAKPVPVQPANFRDPKWGDIRVSLAGIAVNLALALLLTGLAALATVLGQGPGTLVFRALYLGVYLNLILAFFNLIPIPPLDGSHVVYHFLPRGMRAPYRRAGRYGLLVLMALIFLVPDAFAVLLGPVDVIMGQADRFLRLWI